MSKGNNKSIFISIFLHCFAIFCLALYLYVSDFFVEEEKEDKFVFEMQDLPVPTQAEIPTPSQPKVAEDISPIQENFIEKMDIKEAKPIEIPEVIPEPAPLAKPEPAIKPVAKPTPKVEAKPKPKVEPKPELISIADFNRQRAKPIQPQKPVTTTPKISKISPISVSSSNFDSAKASTVSPSDNTALLRGYMDYLKKVAKAKYVLPSEARAMRLSVRISFNVSSKGLVSGVKILKSSGNAVFDNSVKNLFSGLNVGVNSLNQAIENVSLEFESN